MNAHCARASRHPFLIPALFTLAFACLPVPQATAASPVAQRLAVTTTGFGAGDLFGRVSGAGDVNGDGYADWIVGAPFNDANGINAGRAYLYWGGPQADNVPDLIMQGFGDNFFFGTSVSTAGDMNRDGYADVIVGATGASSNRGQVYIFLGGSAMDAIADLTITGEQPGDGMGISVSSAGDVNRDGFEDVIMGASLHDFAGVDAGRVYVFYGGVVLDGSSDVHIDGPAAGDQFGQSVSGAGDMNGDGHADFMVGAPFHDFAFSNAGRAYVFFGGNPTNNTADWAAFGESANARFGISVSDAGDVNGDGYGDLIVGADQQSTSASSAGRAYVYHGGPSPDATPDLILNSTATDDVFGASVSGAGDVNGDGYADVIVGSYLSDAGGFDAGRAYVYYGGPGANGIADHILSSAGAGDNFGHSVSGLGDVFGDGLDDVIVGARTNDAGGLDAGRAYVYDLNRYFLTTPNGGDTWNVGAWKSISWLGAEPADVWLSLDGGNSYQMQQTGVGGSNSNVLQVRVPHTPTKFAMVKVTPSNHDVAGADASDSLFTIQTSVALLALLAAPLPQGGASVSWESNPGPEDLSGYKVDASASGSSSWRTVAALTRETSIVDPEGGPGTRYRLFAVNGFGEELWLGEAAIQPRAALTAWPLPYRGGVLNVSFAAIGGATAEDEVSIYDLHGRLVKHVARGRHALGNHVVAWDGRDASGRDVASGVYFLRSASGGERTTLRLCVLR